MFLCLFSKFGKQRASHVPARDFLHFATAITLKHFGITDRCRDVMKFDEARCVKWTPICLDKNWSQPRIDVGWRFSAVEQRMNCFTNRSVQLPAFRKAKSFKQTVSHAVNKGNLVFSAFLDESKAVVRKLFGPRTTIFKKYIRWTTFLRWNLMNN